MRSLTAWSRLFAIAHPVLRDFIVGAQFIAPSLQEGRQCGVLLQGWDYQKPSITLPQKQLCFTLIGVLNIFEKFS